MWKLFIFLGIFFISCSEEAETPDSTTAPVEDPVVLDTPNKLYVCDQGSDRVVVLDPNSTGLSVLSTITIDFDDSQMDNPHFIVIDELSGFWFVTTMGSGYVGMYSLETDELISSILLGDSPALMDVDEANKKLYVSRMMEMNMMSGSEGSKINVLDYSTGSLVREDDICLAESANVFEFPQPHAISFSSNTTRGPLLLSASFTHDWFSRTDVGAGSVNMTMAVPFVEGEVAPFQVDELFPLSVVQKDDYAFFSLSGSALKEGQVQSWVVGELSNPSLKSTYKFYNSSKLWHIIESPTSNHIYVVLSGSESVEESAGVACLSYNNAEEFIDCNDDQSICEGDEGWDDSMGDGDWGIGEQWTDTGNNQYDDDGVLVLDWLTTDSSFDTLHGITASSDGAYIWVSSRGDGSVYQLDAITGQIVSIATGVGMMMDDMGMGMDMGSLSGIAVTHSE